MGLFTAFKKTLRATAHTAMLPIDVASDIFTLGGASTESGESAIVKRGERISKDFKRAIYELGED
jgi:hypothetical protein